MKPCTLVRLWAALLLTGISACGGGVDVQPVGAAPALATTTAATTSAAAATAATATAAAIALAASIAAATPALPACLHCAP